MSRDFLKEPRKLLWLRASERLVIEDASEKARASGTPVEEPWVPVGRREPPRTNAKSPPPSEPSRPLPRDVTMLHQMIDGLVDQLKETRRELEQEKRKVNNLLQRIYGPKDETVDPSQLRLFADEFLFPTPPDEPEEEEEDSSPARRRKKKRSRRTQPLERRRTKLELTEAERLCDGCGVLMEAIREEVSEQMELQPQVVYIEETVRPVYACRKGCCKPRIAKKPPQPIEQARVGPALLAHIATSKYGDHLPLYRQHGILARYGIHIPRSTMCDWIRAISELVSPLVDYLKRDILRSFFVSTDDTGVLVLDRENGTTFRGRLWVYCGDRDHPWLVYDYTNTRGRDGPEAFLDGYVGNVQADAYSGYDRLFRSGRVRELACAMHWRRYYWFARETEPIHAHQAIAMIDQLFRVERRCRGKNPEARYAYRREHAIPIMERFREWMEDVAPYVVPKSPLGDAIRYSRNQWDALQTYLEDGRFEIDNGISERALRPGAIGRRNWLFFGSPAGGDRAAKLYTLIGSCIRNGLDPEAYLRFVLRELPRIHHARLGELTPLAWAASRSLA